LNDENKFNYKFVNLPIISGVVMDYLVCFLLGLVESKIDCGDYESIVIFMSILHNV